MNQTSITQLFPQIRARAKVWLEVGDQYAFGLGISEILKAVQETGSIKQAAARVGKSYRHIWARIKEAEQALGHQLVETHQGGGAGPRSVCSPEALQLLKAFDQLRGTVMRTVERELTQL